MGAQIQQSGAQKALQDALAELATLKQKLASVSSDRERLREKSAGQAKEIARQAEEIVGLRKQLDSRYRMARPIKRLLSLSDTALFAVVCEGIQTIMKYVEHLQSCAERLSKIGEPHGEEIMASLAEEEAAKVLILVDFIRCPKQSHLERKKTLQAFYSHTAKAIYACLCDHSSPRDWEDTEQQVEYLKEAYYLDGGDPTEEIDIQASLATGQRMPMLYVDYYELDLTVDNGTCQWGAPTDLYFCGHKPRESVTIARALHHLGLTTREGLKVMAEYWRPTSPNDWVRESKWHLNGKYLDYFSSRAGDQRTTHGDEGRLLCDAWPLPLYPLNFLKTTSTPLSDLRAKRAERVNQLMRLHASRKPPLVIASDLAQRIISAFEDCRHELDKWPYCVPSPYERIETVQNAMQRLQLNFGLNTDRPFFRLVCEREASELQDLNALSHYGRYNNNHWPESRSQTEWFGRKPPGNQVLYAISGAPHWSKGLERFENPPRLPRRLMGHQLGIRPNEWTAFLAQIEDG